MLVLSREKGEEIIITVGDTQIQMRVADLDRHRVRLGFNAPLSVVIDRRETHDRKQRQATPQQQLAIQESLDVARKQV